MMIDMINDDDMMSPFICLVLIQSAEEVVGTVYGEHRWDGNRAAVLRGRSGFPVTRQSLLLLRKPRQGQW